MKGAAKTVAALRTALSMLPPTERGTQAGAVKTLTEVIGCDIGLKSSEAPSTGHSPARSDLGDPPDGRRQRQDWVDVPRTSCRATATAFSSQPPAVERQWRFRKTGRLRWRSGWSEYSGRSVQVRPNDDGRSHTVAMHDCTGH
jgi:hypothetical protein